MTDTTQINNYTNKVAQLNGKYPALKTEIKNGWGGKITIEVATVDKAKACNEIFKGFRFSSGHYV